VPLHTQGTDWAGKNPKILTWFKLRMAEAGTKAGEEEDEEEAWPETLALLFLKMIRRGQERTLTFDVFEQAERQVSLELTEESRR
jgi:hypothetical protein